ncbi:MAG TPA: SH3 domain-containing protein, partial [Clostridia bacterium]|nr:SH3 domain-containing protein [Clostridia bacterium]
MKMTCWLLFGAMLSTSLLAQQVTNPPPSSAPLEAPAATNAPAPAITTPTESPATNAPETKTITKKATPKKKAQKKPAAPKKRAELRTVPLTPGPATVDANHVNVRGQAKLNSEVITRLEKSQKVTVIEEIVRNDSGPEEPSAWAKIVLPTDAHVWVHSNFVDATNKTVIPRKLNMRGGPGENYSILGQLVRGDTVTQTSAKGDWLQIEAPTNAFAFVAAQYLKQEAPETTPVAPATPEDTTPTEPATVAETPAIAAAPVETPETNAPAATTTNAPVEIASAPSTTAEEPAAAEDEPPPKRIVQREGVVRGTVSIQAPTQFELYSPESRRTINWLHTTSPDLDLRRYKGLRIIVTGEEGLEERWG